ncbi:MAG: EcsC family protein [Deltaproteobacteria bacterium]|nr:EcsC family protein [Deltaproteobacteria bacterium]
MASPWRVIAEGLGTRVDEDLLPAMYAAASVSTSQVREELRRAGLAFVDEEAGLVPEPDELRRAVDHVVRSAQIRASAMGAVTGLAGAAAMPPELVAAMVNTLRLGQRLAVVHGFDPETDHGKIVLTRALAAAMGVELPDSTRVATRVSELPVLVRAAAPGSSGAVQWAARYVVERSVGSAAARVVRLVPGLGAGIAALSAWRRQKQVAARMCAVFHRAMDALSFDIEGEQDAIEVR